MRTCSYGKTDKTDQSFSLQIKYFSWVSWFSQWTRDHMWKCDNKSIYLIAVVLKYYIVLQSIIP